jgi:dCTP deaminase
MLSGLEILKAIKNQKWYENRVKIVPEGTPPEPSTSSASIDPDHNPHGPRIVIEPFNKEQLNPNSYNLRLDKKLMEYRVPTTGSADWTPDNYYLDPRKENPITEYEIPEEGEVLEPGRLYLGSTIEYTESWNCVPAIAGRSSTGRLGIWVHITAGFGDVGFCGKWTLEIAVIHPVKVYPGMEICQINYDNVGKHEEYDGKYSNKDGPVASGMYKEFNSKI